MLNIYVFAQMAVNKGGKKNAKAKRIEAFDRIK